MGCGSSSSALHTPRTEERPGQNNDNKNDDNKSNNVDNASDDQNNHTGSGEHSPGHGAPGQAPNNPIKQVPHRGVLVYGMA